MAIAIAKASVESMIKNMAEELGPYGIRVNAVGAGHIVTDLNAGTPQARREQMAQATPDLGGTATTRQVGEAIRAHLSRIAVSDK